VSMEITNQFPASPYHHPSIHSYDDDWWLLWLQLACLLCAGLDLWLGCCQKSLAIICPTSEPKPPQCQWKSPINFLQVHTIILQYIHMMMIGGRYGYSLPACCVLVLGWICGWDNVVRNHRSL
jgi:hypothetical protein